MKSLALFFCVFFLVACGDTVHNHYYIVNDGDIIACPDNDCEGVFHPDENSDNKQPDELIDFENDLDEEAIDSDSNTEEPEEISPDIDDSEIGNDADNFFDYCLSVLDSKGEQINGAYAQAPDGTTTVLNIETESLVEEKTCQITFLTSSNSSLDGLKIKTSTLPVKMMVVENKSQEYYFFATFLTTLNYLRLELYKKENEEMVLDSFFKRN
jgi:hypothetical protein